LNIVQHAQPVHSQFIVGKKKRANSGGEEGKNAFIQTVKYLGIHTKYP
jgi:hypothetical protein